MTANDNSHAGDVSTFDLDVYWASGQHTGTDLAKHVAGCARCQGYLASLDEALLFPAPAPALVTASTSATREAQRPVRGLPGWVLPLAGALALAASVLFFGRGRSVPEPGGPGYVAIKGTPAVELLVQREQGIARWDERSPVHPGDRIALRVACEGLARVTVAAPQGETWGRLSETACPASGDPLPFTLVVDDEPGDEQLAVVLSQARLDEAALTAAIRRVDRAGDVWVVQLVLPKTGTAP